jgi:hypothetical protein
MMSGLLVRVGADLSSGGGSWNAPVDEQTGKFVYAAIPETAPVYHGIEKPFSALTPALSKFGVNLPAALLHRHMHLDPDFDHLTYGDQGERAKQLRMNLQCGDLVVFYAALADIRAKKPLIYAIIGLFVVESFLLAAEVRPEDRDINAHSRRVLKPGATDLIIRGQPGASGRLLRCIPIGEYRDRAYRVRHDILAAWGDLSVKNGYLQRSARLPRFLYPSQFLRWFDMQRPCLMQSNN